MIKNPSRVKLNTSYIHGSLLDIETKRKNNENYYGARVQSYTTGTEEFITIEDYDGECFELLVADIKSIDYSSRVNMELKWFLIHGYLDGNDEYTRKLLVRDRSESNIRSKDLTNIAFIGYNKDFTIQGIEELPSELINSCDVFNDQVISTIFERSSGSGVTKNCYPFLLKDFLLIKLLSKKFPHELNSEIGNSLLMTSYQGKFSQETCWETGLNKKLDYLIDTDKLNREGNKLTIKDIKKILTGL